MRITNNGGYYRKYTNEVNSLDIRLLEALMFMWNGDSEGSPIIRFKSVVATRGLGDSMGFAITKGDRIFITRSPLPETVEFILSEEALDNILHLLFSLSPKLHKEALDYVSSNMGKYLSEWELNLLEQRVNEVDDTISHLNKIFNLNNEF